MSTGKMQEPSETVPILTNIQQESAGIQQDKKAPSVLGIGADVEDTGPLFRLFGA